MVAVKIDGVGGPPTVVMADIERAQFAANDALADLDGDELTRAASPALPTPRGVMVALDSVEDEEDTQQWLAAFAENLERAGRSGKVFAAPIAWPSPALQKAIGRESGNALTAMFLGYSLEP